MALRGGGGGGGGGQQAPCSVAKQAVEFPQVLTSYFLLFHNYIAQAPAISSSSHTAHARGCKL